MQTMDNILLKESLGLSNRSIMCRLCLATNGVTEPIGYGDQYLTQKIYECTSIQITPLAGIPSFLCTICRARLEDFYQFRWQCIKNNEIFHQLAADTNDRPVTVSGGTRVRSELANIAETDKRLHDLIYSSNMREATGMVQHTEAKLQPQALRTMGTDANEGYSSFGSTNLEPEQINPVVAEMPMIMRRKRGRPPKRQFDFGAHLLAKRNTPTAQMHPGSQARFAESKWNNTSGTSGSVPQIDQEPSNSSSENPESEQWFKVKLEQTEQHVHQTRNDQLQHNPIIRQTADSKIQPFVQMGVKRSRGRPPREGGCPNEDREEYRFCCQYCSARFKAAINLKLHTNTHTGEKPYLCTICNKSFAHPSNLSVHIKLHSNPQSPKQVDGQQKSVASPQQEKKFQCPYCKTLFALAFQLKIHINTHTGQKPYVCKNCGKGFAQPSNLHVHGKKHCRRKQPQFCETSTGETQSSSNSSFSPAMENPPVIHTAEAHGAVAAFGGLSSYQAQNSSLSPMPSGSAARPMHHPSNIDETLRNDHSTMNVNHAMLV